MDIDELEPNFEELYNDILLERETLLLENAQLKEQIEERDTEITRLKDLMEVSKDRINQLEKYVHKIAKAIYNNFPELI